MHQWQSCTLHEKDTCWKVTRFHSLIGVERNILTGQKCTPEFINIFMRASNVLCCNHTRNRVYLYNINQQIILSGAAKKETILHRVSHCHRKLLREDSTLHPSQRGDIDEYTSFDFFKHFLGRCFTITVDKGAIAQAYPTAANAKFQ